MPRWETWHLPDAARPRPLRGCVVQARVTQRVNAKAGLGLSCRGPPLRYRVQRFEYHVPSRWRAGCSTCIGLRPYRYTSTIERTPSSKASTQRSVSKAALRSAGHTHACAQRDTHTHALSGTHTCMRSAGRTYTCMCSAGHTHACIPAYICMRSA